MSYYLTSHFFTPGNVECFWRRHPSVDLKQTTKRSTGSWKTLQFFPLMFKSPQLWQNVQCTVKAQMWHELCKGPYSYLAHNKQSVSQWMWGTAVLISMYLPQDRSNWSNSTFYIFKIITSDPAPCLHCNCCLRVKFILTFLGGHPSWTTLYFQEEMKVRYSQNGWIKVDCTKT